jgi:hypothetical protein
MHARSFTTLVVCAFFCAVAALPTESLDKRTGITLPGSTKPLIDLDGLLDGLGDFSPIEDGFLEGDVDTGGGSGKIGFVH